LINHPRLHPEIQRQLKELYTADRMIKGASGANIAAK
jgi:hypothetical protein